MRIVVQRSKESSVYVDGKLINKIDFGYVLLVGFKTTDTIKDIEYGVKKVLNLRIFDDEEGKMNLSIKDVHGKILSISQFTLYGDTKNGNRPCYIEALKREEAIHLYNKFNELLNEEIETLPGVYGADMEVHIKNDGPATILIES